MELAARFDDFPGGRSLLFRRSTETVVATEPGQVAGALRRVERRCADGHWAYGFLAYEAAPGLDPGLVTHPPAPGLPLVWFAVGDPPVRARPAPASPGAGGYRIGPWRVEWDAGEHRARVRRVRELIEAGETYQCNLTTRLRAGFDGDPAGLYADLAGVQRGGFCAFLRAEEFALLSASPELFFERRGRRLRMRPMKGTAPRGRTLGQDALLAERLRTDPKERAENVMIVDLLRNDAGRIAVPGSVVTSRLCQVERYGTVLQLTTGIEATLREDCPLVEVFTALFPCGSVTGAPKPRTMEIIRELETGPRGAYCGAIGYLTPDGGARFNVAIRTVTLDRSGRAVFGTGGGITWSSDPEAEYAELLTKASVLGSEISVPGERVPA